MNRPSAAAASSAVFRAELIVYTISQEDSIVVYSVNSIDVVEVSCEQLVSVDGEPVV